MNSDLNNGNARSSIRTASQFVWLIPHLTQICQEHGYGMGVHGSMIRDLDVIACPWEDSPSDAKVLIKDVVEKIGGYFLPNEQVPVSRPHGRLVWPIHLHRDYYIDFSVMPKL